MYTQPRKFDGEIDFVVSCHQLNLSTWQKSAMIAVNQAGIFIDQETSQSESVINYIFLLILPFNCCSTSLTTFCSPRSLICFTILECPSDDDEEMGWRYNLM